MAVFDLFSKRRKQLENAGKPDVYSYDAIPKTLRVQIVHIWHDALGDYKSYNEKTIARWRFIHDVLTREKGVFRLHEYKDDYDDQCISWFLGTNSLDDALDVIELTFRVLEHFVGKMEDWEREYQSIKIDPRAAIEELNTRFKEHGVGYQFENGELIRIDSQYIHSQISKPALTLLSGKGFETANEEFLTAHRHYRAGENKDCVVACQRAFESTLKAICARKKWKFANGDRLPELIKLVRAKGLFPDYLDNAFDTYVAMLKTGLPSIRNNAGGHGAGPNESRVPAYIAGYALHTTASNIVLAAEALKAR